MLLRKSRRVKFLGPLLLGGLSLVMCMVLGVSLAGPFLPDYPCTRVPDPLHPPIYPNAEHVAVSPNTVRVGLERSTTFDTPDDADTVLAYYRDKMISDGWFLEYDLKNAQEYAAYCNTSSSHPMRAKVVVQSRDDGRTHVQLRVY